MARPAMLTAAAILVFAAFAAGCSQSNPQPTPGTSTDGGATAALSFNRHVVVDPVRIASEPQVKAAMDGSLFICAPTGNVKYATRPLDLPAEADKGVYQSAIWSSRDNGTSWQFSQMAIPYHSALPGGGDCALGIDAAGTVFMTDQLGLVSEVMSVSKDNGNTWAAASPLASGYPGVDRQWIGADPKAPGTVYLVYNHQALGLTVSKSTDSGSTWTPVPVTPLANTANNEGNPPGPMVVTNKTVGFSYYFNGDIHFAHSEDQGVTYTIDKIAPDHGTIGDLFPATMADTAGNLYIAWVENGEGGSDIKYVVSADAGKTWGASQLAFHQPGKALFMWGVAGSPGRLGFSWYGAASASGPYYTEAGMILGAGTDTAQKTSARVAETAAREDAICTGGTTCTSGRELGDFQSCTLTPDGKLVVSFVIVAGKNEAGQPSGGHIAFAREMTGPSLFAPGDMLMPWVV